MLHLLHPLDGLAGGDGRAAAPAPGIGEVKVFCTKRACPVCGTSYPELDPRMFSYNSKHGWCTGCVGTGLTLTREQRKAYDDSVRDDDDKGREQSFPAEEPEVEGLVDEPCADCRGARLNAGGARRDLRRTRHQRDRAPVGARDAAPGSTAWQLDRPRRRDRARRGRPRSAAGSNSWPTSAWAT